MSKMGWFGVVKGHPRSFKIAPFHRAHTSSYQPSIVTMSLSCTVSEIQRDIGRKSPILTYPPLLCAPLRVIPLEFRQYFWRQKTRVPRLLQGVAFVILGLAIFEGHRLVSDRQTDRQTHDASIYCASIASRGKQSVLALYFSLAYSVHQYIGDPHFLMRVKQFVALTSRNTTGPPCNFTVEL